MQTFVGTPSRLTRRILATVLIALGAGLGGAQAQLPLPSEPGVGKRPQCTRDYVQSVRRLEETLEKMRTAGPEAVGRVCTMIEMGSILLGGKLPDSVRQELRTLLGHDVDLERVMAQCRAGQDAVEREITASLGRARSELMRCSDTI